MGDRSDLVSTVAFLVAFVPSVFHWSGLLVSGALVGIVAPSVSRALLTGLYLGFALLFAFAVYLWWLGSLSAFLGMGIVLYASAGLTVLLPTLAAGAVRGLT